METKHPHCPPHPGTDGGAGEGAIQAVCLVAAGKGGVNCRTSPRPATTRVTLIDYSVSSALITLRRPPPAAPQPAPAPVDQYQEAHTGNLQPIPSKAWTHHSTKPQNRKDLRDQFIPRTGSSLGQGRCPVPLTLASPAPSQGLARTALPKSLPSESINLLASAGILTRISLWHTVPQPPLAYLQR